MEQPGVESYCCIFCIMLSSSCLVPFAHVSACPEGCLPVQLVVFITLTTVLSGKLRVGFHSFCRSCYTQHTSRWFVRAPFAASSLPMYAHACSTSARLLHRCTLPNSSACRPVPSCLVLSCSVLSNSSRQSASSCRRSSTPMSTRRAPSVSGIVRGAVNHGRCERCISINSSVCYSRRQRLSPQCSDSRFIYSIVL